MAADSGDVYYSLVSQHDNLGDLIIRKVVLDWLYDTSLRIHVLTAGMPRKFIDAFELREDVHQVDGRIAFETSLLASAARGTANLVFAPGPHSYSNTPRSLIRSVENLFNVRAVRLRGGLAVAIGRAVRGSGNVGRSAERANIRSFSKFIARDEVSDDFVGIQLDHAPDVAFGASLALDLPKSSTVAVSLRGDRELDEEAFALLVSTVRESGRSVILVTQVQRDDQLHRRLAAQHDLGAVFWEEETDHSTQLMRIREAYSRSEFVVSDRLHGLIVGAVCGCTPIHFSRSTSDKIEATLRGRLTFKSLDNASTTEELAEAFASGTPMKTEAEAAARELETVRRSVLDLLSVGDRR